MKSKQRIHLFFYCAFGLFLLLPVFLFSQETVYHTISFYKGDLEIDNVVGKDEREYTKLTYYNSETTREPGTPALPIVYVNLIVPSGLGVTNVSIELPGGRTSMSVSAPVYPAQPAVSLGYESINLKVPYDSTYFKSPEFVPMYEDLYSSQEFWPAEIVKVVHAGYVDGNNQILRLEVCPLRYYYSRGGGSLEFYPEIEMNIEMSGESRLRPLSGNRSNPDLYTILEVLVDNDVDIKRYMTPQNSDSTRQTRSPDLPYYDYVIITDQVYEDYFSDLICWKTRLGYITGVVTCQEIYAEYPNGDLISGINDHAGSIRQYLYDAYMNGTQFVLLAGDHDKVPVRYGCGIDNPPANDFFNIIPADLYYADLNGDWDEDSDPCYGEPAGDAVDYLPELIVGRIPIGPTGRSPEPPNECKTYIENWVQKVIYYEMGIFNTTGNYPLNMFWLEVLDYFEPPSQVIIPSCPPAFIHTVWGRRQGTDVVSEMSTGYGFVSWYSYGNDISFTTDSFGPSYLVQTFDSDSPESTNDGLDNMTNTGLYTIAYPYFGFAGAYDHAIHPEPKASLVEGWTHLNKEACGPGILANTRWGYYFKDGTNLEELFFDLVSAGGQMLRISYADQLSKYNYGDHYMSLSHNAFCCPEEKLWTGQLGTIPVTINDNGSSIEVVMDDGVSATVCVMTCEDGGQTYHEVNQGTSVGFNTEAQGLFVTVSRDNYAPYVTKIRDYQGRQLGDVYYDGQIDITDALYTAQAILGLFPFPCCIEYMDVNCDGKIDIMDALLIAQYWVGLVTEFPCSSTPGPTPAPTPTPVPGAGEIWLVPQVTNVSPSDPFQVEVHMNTGTQPFGASHINFSYDPAVIDVDTTIEIDGVESDIPGINLSAKNPGLGFLKTLLFFSGISEPSSDLHLMTIHFQAGTTSGVSTDLTMFVNSLYDTNGAEIGIPNGIPGIINVGPVPTPIPTPPPPFCGDVNGNGNVDIIDALLIAQCYVRLIDCPLLSVGDVNNDGVIDIVDALLIAQCYVGLPCQLSCPSPLTPAPTPESVTYEMQAEEAQYSSGEVLTDHDGYTGTGFVNTENAVGEWIEWSVEVEDACNATCAFRYACGAGARPMNLTINNNDEGDLIFSLSSAWNDWQTEKADVILDAGLNAIRLTATSSGGAPHMDKMDITIYGGEVGSPPPTSTPTPPTPTPTPAPTVLNE